MQTLLLDCGKDGLDFVGQQLNKLSKNVNKTLKSVGKFLGVFLLYIAINVVLAVLFNYQSRITMDFVRFLQTNHLFAFTDDVLLLMSMFADLKYCCVLVAMCVMGIGVVTGFVYVGKMVAKTVKKYQSQTNSASHRAVADGTFSYKQHVCFLS